MRIRGHYPHTQQKNVAACNYTHWKLITIFFVYFRDDNLPVPWNCDGQQQNASVRNCTANKVITKTCTHTGRAAGLTFGRSERGDVAAKYNSMKYKTSSQDEII